MQNIKRHIGDILAGIVIVLVPFHAFLTVWAGHNFGHYMIFRLWSAFILAGLLGYTAWVVLKTKQFGLVLRGLLTRLIGLYTLYTTLFGLVALLYQKSSIEAVLYGVYSNTRYLIFFLCVLAVSAGSRWLHDHWRRFILSPALVVGLFAWLQYLVLPLGFLAYFGYDSDTIPSIETINGNFEFIRVGSTLRGSNPLGAYLVVIIAIVAVLFMRGYRRRLMAPLLIISTGALIFSFSRSAWLGALLAIGAVAVVSLHSQRSRRLAVVAVVASVLLGGTSFAILRHNRLVQNALYHTEDRSTVKVSSNDARATALETGLHDVLHEPFGRGPGTAGPASVYNTKSPARISENYYLQLGQEVGWFGLGIFVAIQVLVLKRLYRLRQDPLAVGLFASGIGLVLVNMLSHAWTDDTLAFIWWGLAGIALGVVAERQAQEDANPGYRATQSEGDSYTKLRHRSEQRHGSRKTNKPTVE